MKPIFVFAAITLSIAALAADKDKRFTARPADSYPNKQSQEKVTVAAVPYVNDDELKTAFGKANPVKFGVLPVLVVIQNDSNKTLALDLTTEYIDSDGRHIEAIPSRDVGYVAKSPKRPNTGPSPVPIPLPKKKNPLDSWEIDGRAFAAKMIPAGQSVNGFFYFQTKLQPGAKLYLTGMREANSGKELFYFEIPLTDSK